MARLMMHCNRNCATQNKYYNRTASRWSGRRLLGAGAAADFRWKNIALNQQDARNAGPKE
jgi:hypothetical protein